MHNTNGHVQDANGHSVCEIADGRLDLGDMLAAAPDMLVALRELVAEADNPHGWNGHPHKHTLGFAWARAAIAKAEGGSQ